MKKYQAAIIINREIANKIFEMKLQFKILPALLPGQFVNLSVPGFFLRRPISICEQDPDQNTITLVYKVVGKGTKKLTTLDPDLQVDLLMPLGNGFQIKKMQEKNPKQIVIAGGGV
ncbi:MAG: dihydroorotate dehydrogenase electron transfer subunit, partial [Clostridiaceae bacterium]|nr:dihydroorotate dehydrogenase electron transfer subunit [Clostridiaceae bacterium]